MSAPASPDRITREETIFNAAIELCEAAKRAAYLDLACEGDPALRARLEKMLAADTDSFFEKPIPPPALADAAPLAASAVPASEPVVLSEQIGRYKLLQKIGEGGCGVVYMAGQEEPVRRRVALKVIKLGMDTKSVIARFEAERQALALMDHPNIAKVLDAGATDEGRPYFVMELVRGVKITEYCDQHNVPTRDRLDLFIKVCQAIQHAHQKGIIHRDIKPSNILVTLHDGVPVPKVIDFGIAKATTDQRLTDKTLFTALEQFIGTPAYMSPEQAEMSGLDLDTRCDIYSLGVLLYELLTGKTPFDAKELLASGLDEMRKTIREQVPLKPSTRVTRALVAAEVTRRTAADEPSASSRRRLQELVNLLRGDVDWIVMKCLEKDRARRYETANGLASDIQRHLNNETVLARPPSAAYRLQKLVRRNTLAVAAVTTVTTVLALGVIVSTWQAIRATRANAAEKEQRLVAEAQRERADAQARKASESERHSRRLLYASDMNLGQQALKLNNVGRALRSLERNRPQAGEEDLRGWEWRYLWQLTRNSALLTLTNRSARGTSVSFSRDGALLAVGWHGGRVELWDVPGRRWVRAVTDRAMRAKAPDRHHQAHVAFSPIRNLLAATGSNEEVFLYDLDSGRDTRLWRVPEDGLWDIREISFSKDSSKLVIYAGSTRKVGDAVWVVDVSSGRIEGQYPTDWSNSELHGAAQLSPDNRRLYLARSDSANNRYSIQCLDLATGKELWQTKHQRDYGLTALALSPDGQILASGSGFEEPAIRIWEASSGKLLTRLDGHTGWVSDLTFTADGHRLISAASDQSIRFWDAETWTESKVLRGHTDEVYAVALSESTQLLASAGKDGNLILWKEDGKSAADPYQRLSGNVRVNEVFPLDESRVLLLPPGELAELVDLKGDSTPVPLPEVGSSTNVLGVFGTNILCLWNGTNTVLVKEWRGRGFVEHGTIPLNSGKRPVEFNYSPAGKMAAWTEGPPSKSIKLASLAAPDRRSELTSDVDPLALLQFSEDGKHLSATSEHAHSLRAWNLDTGVIAASLNERVRAVGFAASGRVLVAAIEKGNDHEIGFFDLDHPGQVPRRLPGKGYASSLAVSHNGRLVASASAAGELRLFDALNGELIDSVHAHLNGCSSVAFSGDGRRLISTSGGREAVKLWDVGTRQELLTFAGTGSLLESARWSADGTVILAGPPWQAWRAPSWEEIAAAEAKEKMKAQRQ